MLVLDGTPTTISAYQRWYSKSDGLFGDKSMCFNCWYEKNVREDGSNEVRDSALKAYKEASK